MVENSLKQRIIGAVVLIALAIIFLPAILKEKTSNGVFVSKIPPMPSVLVEYQVDGEAINQLESQAAAPIEQELLKQEAKYAEQEPLPVSLSESPDKASGDDNSEQQSKDEIKSLGTDYKAAAWVVQVASFSHEANAVKLVDKLKKKNFKAYRRTATLRQKTLYRVYVGPYVEQKDAKKTLPTITALSQSKAMVRPFDPIAH